MQDKLTISIYEVVSSPLCVASGDGQKVYERLAAVLKENRQVSLSFRNVSTLTPTFLNTAVGQLYSEFSEEQVRALLKVQDIQADDSKLLKRVVETAKAYFKDRESFDRAYRDEFGNECDHEQGCAGTGI